MPRQTGQSQPSLGVVGGAEVPEIRIREGGNTLRAGISCIPAPPPQAGHTAVARGGFPHTDTHTQTHSRPADPCRQPGSSRREAGREIAVIMARVHEKC